MGFYGNITNTARSQFIFDRIYPNRAAADANCTSDGVYAGRYILVEYDTGVSADIYPEKYRGENNSIKVYENGSDSKFTTIAVEALNETQSPYWVNAQIDIAAYGRNRGYDSTVWQKVYTDGQEKYVMIAELNTVVPTFEVTTDAPTEVPMLPHFGKDSTNIYYNLHWQPQWGFRVAPANKNQELTSRSTNLPSDEKISIKGQELDGAIYYNKAGFSSDKSSFNDINDNISITSTGFSGNEYNLNETSINKEKQIDTQELSIILPSLGNAMSQIWDLVYGHDEEKRNKVIAWEDAAGEIKREGNRLVTKAENGYTLNTNSVETIAGAINSVHDLMGMIIVDGKVEVSKADENKIYYYDGKFWRKSQDFTYTEIPNNDFEFVLDSTVNEFSYLPDYYYLDSNGAQIASDKYNNSLDYYIKTYNKKNDNLCVVQDTKDIYAVGSRWQTERKIVPACVTLGSVSQNDTMVPMEGFAQDVNTLHGLILQVNKVLNIGNVETRDTTTVQGALNTLNDYLNRFKLLPSNSFVVTDKFGRLTGATFTEDPDSQDAFINFEINSDLEHPTFTIRHASAESRDKITVSNKKEPITDLDTYNANADLHADAIGINNTMDSVLRLSHPIVKNGHIIGIDKEYVTLPDELVWNYF